MPVLAEVLVRVTERRRARSVWKFRPWSREMKMARNAGGDQTREAARNCQQRGLCSNYRRCNLSESYTHTTRSQIWDGGETVKL